jgi:tagatose 1,6-diphosphate aldolase GatY/KbaY
VALVRILDLVKESAAQKKVIVAFNVFNDASIDAVLRAAKEAGRPVMLEANESDLFHYGIEELAAVARIKAEKAKVDVSLHLDHGMSVDVVAKCIRAGFTSVMIDPSEFEDAQKVPKVRAVMDFARPLGVMVESMVGQLSLAAGLEGGHDAVEERTDPEAAERFVQATGIDVLAVSVGTEHGSFLVGKQAQIDMPRLRQIAARVDIPLVVHGGSAVSDEQLRELRNFHVGKMNVGGAIRVAFRKGMMEAYQESELADVQDALDRAKQKMYEVALHKIRVLGC